MADPTADFPTYAELTQTRAWRAATAPISPTEPVVGAAADARYAEGELLGSGGMGRVVLARDSRIGREVALKELRTDREIWPELQARFLREARVQGQLEHPSIVPVYDIDERTDGTTFFTMRRVVGRTLMDIIDDLRKEEPMAVARYTQRELLTAFATMCLTVDYAHSRGVVHRDLKPSNIMLGDFAEVYVLDWGLARLLADPSQTPPGARLSIPGLTMGTPMYMAPEQLTSSDVGATADVFALGAILFEMLTLEMLRNPRAPFVPADARPSVRAPARGVAQELEAICVRATDEDPAARYPTARALQEAIIHFLDSDRELEFRRTRAADHARAAREALARSTDGASGAAMREAARALAFDPSADHVALLGDVMAALPRRAPAEVERELETSAREFVRSGARSYALVLVVIAAFVPIAISIGILRPLQAMWVIVPYTVACIVSWLMSRRPTAGLPIQYAVYTLTLVAIVATSRMYGPLIMMPTTIAGFAISVQIHPDRSVRRNVELLSLLAIVIVPVLELAGVLQSSYTFEHGTLVIVPQMIELPRTGTIAYLILAALAATVSACAFISRLRERLSEAERRQAIQTWHFKRLAAELANVGSPTATSS